MFHNVSNPYWFNKEIQDHIVKNIGYSRGVAASYNTYLNNFRHALLGFYVYVDKQGKAHNIFDLLPSIIAYDRDKDTDFAEVVLAYLMALPLPNQPLTTIHGKPYTGKGYSNSRSALGKFIEWITYDRFTIDTIIDTIKVKPCAKTDIDHLLKHLKQHATNRVYSYPMLHAIALSRLRTQDRYPIGGAYLPMRVLFKLFAKDKCFRDLIDRYIKNIKVYYYVGNNVDCTTLHDVKELTINQKHEVWVKIDGKSGQYRVATQTAQYIMLGKGNPYRPMNAGDIRGINIQHDKPIANVLRCRANLPRLSELTGLIDHHVETEGLLPNKDLPANEQSLAKIAPKIAKSFDINSISGSLKQDLLGELEMLFKQCPLTLMEEKENKSLNDFDDNEKNIPINLIR